MIDYGDQESWKMIDLSRGIPLLYEEYRLRNSIYGVRVLVRPGGIEAGWGLYGIGSVEGEAMFFKISTFIKVIE